MSFRTIAQLDISRVDVQRDLADRDRMHKRLMSLFPDGLGASPRRAINLLFQCDPKTGELLLQAKMRPSVGPLAEKRQGYFKRVVTRPLSEVSPELQAGQEVEFDFFFAAQERSDGKRKPIQDDETALEKASRQLESRGLQVIDAEIIDRHSIASAARKVSYPSLHIKGKGTITDAEALSLAVVEGVGSGRLWGSGVLLLSNA